MGNINASLILRVGLAFVLLYASIGAFINPDNWIGYFPRFLKDLVPENLLLTSHSIAELTLAIWLLSGWKLFYSSILAALSLIAIVIFNYNQMDVIFRDIGLIFMALSLTVLAKKQ